MCVLTNTYASADDKILKTEVGKLCEKWEFLELLLYFQSCISILCSLIEIRREHTCKAAFAAAALCVCVCVCVIKVHSFNHSMPTHCMKQPCGIRRCSAYSEEFFLM